MNTFTSARKNGCAGRSTGTGTGAGKLFRLCVSTAPSLPALVPALRPAPLFLTAPAPILPPTQIRVNSQ